MKKAWETVAIRITSIVSARTRGEAIQRTMHSARDAGYRIKFTEIKAIRAPEFDEWAEQDSSGACWCRKDLESVRNDVRSKLDSHI